jgi:hypothetical protein
MSTSTLPSYAQTQFVNRHIEIEHVHTQIRKLLDGELIERRTTIFTGEHGMGKSWLLLHLYELHRRLVGLRTIHFDLAFFATRSSAQEILEAICQHLFCELLGQNSPSAMPPESQARHLIYELKRQMLNQYPLVLFIDSVYESTPTVLALLEDNLLAALAVQPNVLLVMAGRGQAYPWREPELRLRADFFTLDPFTLTHTQEQLQCQLATSTAMAQATFDLSLGNPKANWWLAANANQTATLSQVIDEMLLPVPLATRSSMRTYLEALSIPNMFDETTLPILLAAYHGERQPRFISRTEIRQIWEWLLRPGLIFWNSDQGGYTLHPSTRNLILQYLCAVDRERWQRLQQAMIDLYEGWLGVYPQNSSYWQKEAQYHRKQIMRQCV